MSLASSKLPRSHNKPLQLPRPRRFLLCLLTCRDEPLSTSPLYIQTIRGLRHLPRKEATSLKWYLVQPLKQTAHRDRLYRRRSASGRVSMVRRRRLPNRRNQTGSRDMMPRLPYLLNKNNLIQHSLISNHPLMSTTCLNNSRHTNQALYLYKPDSHHQNLAAHP